MRLGQRAKLDALLAHDDAPPTVNSPLGAAVGLPEGDPLFGIGADIGEAQWRSVLRQLIALGYLRTEGEYNPLELDASAREVLRGEVQLLLRMPTEASARGRGAKGRGGGRAGSKGAPIALDDAGQACFDALKAWRASVAREHNLPAYVVFHDATLAEMARLRPQSLDELGAISGVGAKKLDAYGMDILRVVGHDVAS